MIMPITLDNVKKHSERVSPIIRQRVTGSNSKIKYRLVKPVFFTLSNGDQLYIPEKFTWDLSSVPRFLWGILPPDGDFEIASLIHDFLYITKPYSRKFADDEMLKWSKSASGTVNKWSIRNLDNQVRYIAVRLFGWIVWKR